MILILSCCFSTGQLSSTGLFLMSFKCYLSCVFFYLGFVSWLGVGLGLGVRVYGFRDQILVVSPKGYSTSKGGPFRIIWCKFRIRVMKV